MSDAAHRFQFSGKVWFWRGPAPFFFVSVPEAESEELKALMRSVTYGWGMIPAAVRVGETEWTTALWPKDGGYIVPLKDRVRKAEGIVEGDVVTIGLTIGFEVG